MRAAGRDRAAASPSSPCTSDVHTVWEGAIGERSRHDSRPRGRGRSRRESALWCRTFKPGDRVIVPAITPDWGSPGGAGGLLPCTPAACWRAGNSPTSRTACLASSSTSTRPTRNLALLPDGHGSRPRRCMLSDMVPTGFHGVELADVQLRRQRVRHRHRPGGPDGRGGRCAAGRGAAVRRGLPSRLRRGGQGHTARRRSSTISDGDIAEQILDMTHGQGVDQRHRRRRRQRHLCITAVRMLKPGGIIGNVNYLGSGDYVQHAPGGVGLRHGPQDHRRRPDARRTAAHGEAGRADGDGPAGPPRRC